MKGTADLFLIDNNIVNDQGQYAAGHNSSYVGYDYRLNTPWKAGLSLGHTIGNYFALGATYEYAWYNHFDNRIKDGGYYDGWDYYESSSSDKPMNDHTKATLNGVSTLKLGMEYKPIPMLAVRVGYNYVSALYKEDGVRDQTLMCSYDADGNTGVNMATSTDYTNWKAINRFTLGLGFNYKKMFLDLAYQYSAQDGDFYPFMSSKNFGTKEGFTPAISNEVSATKVSNNRHQLLMTLGYKF